ncbi:DUF4097 family beta strand repeat-containing protein [Portibacter marinus]|uniref:hypothetical protein n=1 Tax=Portibacter marinus TaxID=2898660 RepID=UPI001F3CF3DA|nr:hypothetical protein [Portibacter marinus]
MNIKHAILVALAMPCLLAAQSNLSTSYPLNNASSIKLDFQYGDLEIEKHSGNEIKLEANVLVNGMDGSQYFDLDSKRSGNTLELTARADFEGVDKRMTIIMNDGSKIYKDGKNMTIEEVSDDEGVKNVYHGLDVDATFTLKIPENINLHAETTFGSIMIKDYWQDMHIHSTYGSVDAVIKNPPSAPVMKISSTYSEVDLMIPSSVNAALKMTTGFGRIYTDMNIEPEFNSKGKNRHHGQDIDAKLNSGKGSITLDATYSNIYLRKAL